MEVVKVNRNEYKFIFEDADHTIGNLLHKQLLKDPCTFFAGYIVPHPLESKMIVKLITYEKSPREIMNNAFNELIKKLDDLHNLIEPEVQQKSE